MPPATVPAPDLPAPDLVTLAGLLPGPAAVRVGHAHAVGGGWRTGTTVVVPPPGTAGSVVVGGGAPGTRETDALAPGTLVDAVDALVLSGGSAFGLAAADGVVRWCEDDERGFAVPTPAGPARVPVVPAAILFDLGRGGDVRARPTADFGFAAAAAAGAVPDDGPPAPEGHVGAGTGARVDAGSRPGGLGVAGGEVEGTGWRVGALVAANAAGVPAGWAPGDAPAPDTGRARASTTLVVVVTDAPLDTAGCHRLAGASHAGLARAVEPSHTLVDGDVVFALATGRAPADEDPRRRVALETAAARAVTGAFARAVDTEVGARLER
ncbi:P1 family peptidase [Aquipuribacter nitratireducens]|uniref:P1 family peptidase n=1 Tax=Aquipuribacter nitratireducens TaxID=650104 RepID=A0ABW0GMK4_9MICO